MRDQLSLLLRSLEAELRAQGRWEDSPPPAHALRSSEPFAVDYLNFDQWLQWILLPRMSELLLRQLPLPTDCAILPMAEEVYGTQNAKNARVVLLIGEIDALLNGHRSDLN